MPNRIWEIDYLRGLAILLMVFFHLMYDLNEFFNLPITYDSGWIYYIGKLAASLFIILAGISCSLSSNNVRRGLKIFALGLLITVVTYLTVPETNIIFGILHFLGVSILLFPLFRFWSPRYLWPLGILIISIGYYLQGINMPNNFLFPLGLLGDNFYSADYYPLFPWFGLFLWGTALGKTAYSSRKSLFPRGPRGEFLLNLGRHSLLIYLLHQPILLSLLYLLFRLLG